MVLTLRLYIIFSIVMIKLLPDRYATTCTKATEVRLCLCLCLCFVFVCVCRRQSACPCVPVSICLSVIHTDLGACELKSVHLILAHLHAKLNHKVQMHFQSLVVLDNLDVVKLPFWSSVLRSVQTSQLMGFTHRHTCAQMQERAKESTYTHKKGKKGLTSLVPRSRLISTTLWRCLYVNSSCRKKVACFAPGFAIR